MRALTHSKSRLRSLKRNRTPEADVEPTPDPVRGSRPWTPPAQPASQRSGTRVLPPIHIAQDATREMPAPPRHDRPVDRIELDPGITDWVTALSYEHTHERDSDHDIPDLPQPPRTAGAHADEVLFGLRGDEPTGLERYAGGELRDGYAVQRRVATGLTPAAKANQTADEIARANEARFVEMEACIARASGTAAGLDAYWAGFEQRMQRLRAQQSAQDLASGVHPNQVAAQMLNSAKNAPGDDDNFLTFPSVDAATMRIEAAR